MRKGFEWSVSVLMMVIFAVAMAGIFWAGLMGKASAAPATSGDLETNLCNNAKDCLNNLDGAQCLQIYPNITQFCGCVENEDCLNRRSGICDTNNKYKCV